MPLVLADRVRETTTTTGTGTISLAGPVSGFQGFSTAIGNANTTYYTIVDAATGAWEVGLGTYTSSGSTLARTTVLSSSNSDALVPFGAGTKDVFVTQPAERAVYVLGAGTGLAAGAAAFTANGVPYASATNTLTTGSALTYNGIGLGIGVASATQLLNLSGAGTSSIQVVSTDGGGKNLLISVSGSLASLRELNGNPLGFDIGGSEQMRLTSTGLGIGTSSPGEKLQVAGAIRATGAVAANTTGGILAYQGSSVTMLGAWGANASTVGQIQFYLSSSDGSVNGELMRLTSTGLGIGTSSPDAKLDVLGSSSDQIRVRTAETEFYRFGRNSSTGFLDFYGSQTGYQGYTFGGVDGTWATINSSGNLGIGTSSPGAKLDVRDSSTTALTVGSFTNNSSANNTTKTSRIALRLADTTAFVKDVAYITAYPDGANVIDGGLAFSTRSGDTVTERMVLSSSGNLGLGVTPSAWGSSFNAIQIKTGAGWMADGANSYFSANSYWNGTNWIRNLANAAARYQMESGAHSWYTAAGGTAGNAISFTQAMTLDASGRLLIGYTGNTDGSALQVNANSVGSALYTAAFNNSSTSTSAYNSVRFQQGASGSAIGYVGTGGSTVGNAAFQNTFVVGTQSSNALVFNTNDTERMRLDSSGNLGLGVTPSAWGAKAFQVNGYGPALSSFGGGATWGNLSNNSWFDGTNWKYHTTGISAARYEMTGGSGGSTHAWFTAASGTAGNAISFTQAMTLDASGNLGVGETSLTERITARKDGTGSYCTIQAKNANSTATLNIGVGGSAVGNTALQNNGYVMNAGNSALVFGTNDTERARITSGGEVYIAGATDQGAYNLQVNGTGVWGAGAYVNGSDRNLKDNIQSLDSCLDVVMAMRPVTFQYKPEHSKDQSVQPGFIAQELQEAMAGKAYIDGVVQAGPEYLNVAYQNIIPILVKAIQELKAEVAALKGA